MRIIGFLSRWNASCGVSLHAELIGKEFLRLGYRIKVFAPTLLSAGKWWHHKIVRKDESFVKRCYDELTPNLTGGAIDEDAILSEDFDYFIVESYSSLPYRQVEELIPKIKRKAKVVTVIHEGSKEDIKFSSLSIFDKVIIFDVRYKKVIGRIKNFEVIPYPCHPVVEGKRRFAEDKVRFFTFGRQPQHEYRSYIKALDTLSRKYDLTYHVVRSDGPLPFRRPWLHQETIRIDDVYPFLHNCDIHLLPKGKTDKIVVSSTLFLCLGSLIPIVAPNTRHFEFLPEIEGVKPAVIFADINDLERKLVRLIEDEGFRENVKEAARAYVEENRSDKVAKAFFSVLESV